MYHHYSLNGNLHTITLRCHLILSIDADDQRTLESHWTRDITGHTQPEVVVPDATFA